MSAKSAKRVSPGSGGVVKVPSGKLFGGASGRRRSNKVEPTAAEHVGKLVDVLRDLVSYDGIRFRQGEVLLCESHAAGRVRLVDPSDGRRVLPSVSPKSVRICVPKRKPKA